MAVPAPEPLISNFLRIEGTCSARFLQTGFKATSRCLHLSRVVLVFEPGARAASRVYLTQ
jgi:hypothetical protein